MQTAHIGCMGAVVVGLSWSASLCRACAPACTSSALLLLHHYCHHYSLFVAAALSMMATDSSRCICSMLQVEVDGVCAWLARAMPIMLWPRLSSVLLGYDGFRGGSCKPPVARARCAFLHGGNPSQSAPCLRFCGPDWPDWQQLARTTPINPV